MTYKKEFTYYAYLSDRRLSGYEPKNRKHYLRTDHLKARLCVFVVRRLILLLLRRVLLYALVDAVVEEIAQLAYDVEICHLHHQSKRTRDFYLP